MVRADSEVDTFQQPYPEGAEPISDPCPFCARRGELGCSHRHPWKHVPALSWGSLTILSQ